ncbi:MAG: hypothetical protein QM820_32180 [Minicystis sp.]
MSSVATQSPNSPPGKLASFRAALDRLLPWIAVIGSLLIAAGLAFAALAIFRDHDLRVHGLWNGVTGTPAGIAAHQANMARAGLAASVVLWSTVVVGISLAIPRRQESAFFRWTGWISILVAVVATLVFIFAGVGLSLLHGLASFDPTCPLDGPCKSPPRAMAPADWSVTYLGGVALAATGAIAFMSAAAGFRWLIWGIVSLVRRARRAPNPS